MINTPSPAATYCAHLLYNQQKTQQPPGSPGRHQPLLQHRAVLHSQPKWRFTVFRPFNTTKTVAIVHNPVHLTTCSSVPMPELPSLQNFSGFLPLKCSPQLIKGFICLLVGIYEENFAEDKNLGIFKSSQSWHSLWSLLKSVVKFTWMLMCPNFFHHNLRDIKEDSRRVWSDPVFQKTEKSYRVAKIRGTGTYVLLKYEPVTACNRE